MMNGNGGLFKGFQKGCFLTSNGTVMRPSHRCLRFPTRCLSDFNDYAILGLSPFASKYDVKFAYKRLALKYHPDVIKGDHIAEKNQTFREIKSAYESLMQKFEEEEQLQMAQSFDEYEEWDEWMGFEGGMPASYNSC
ncbi:chaperone protein dnaJ A6, chloroplastic [Silene latifolia]|uniref:chaperone protein dnaJ A6, chloroplastic n=1 Tax=Silene latifolia TaxID=37657 RepID=UPI003D7792D4